MKNCIEKYLHYSLDIKQRKIKKRFATSIEKNINGKKKFIFSLLENEIEFIENKKYMGYSKYSINCFSIIWIYY